MTAEAFIDIRAEFPAKLRPLFQPRRYKVMHGGRGGGKSWAVARALLLMAADRPLRILCAREVQKSMRDSVHRLLKDQVVSLNLTDEFEILDNEIRGASGSLFLFTGLQAHTVDSIKSFEGCDIVWVEEAHGVSKKSWDTLIPTIRKPDSEIWLTLNPDMDTDETWRRFIAAPSPDTWTCEINWRDNPWFPAVLEQERVKAQALDLVSYDHIWEGKPRRVAEGAIYRHEIDQLYTDKRVKLVPYDPELPVHSIWDLGWNDAMTIILAQRGPREVRVIGYIEDSNRTLDWYVGQLERNPYRWGTDFLPHDGRTRNFQTGKSTEELLKDMGRTVHVLPQTSIEEGIKAARLLFPKCYFDQDKTLRLVECLKRYRRDINQKTNEPGAPLHDEYSHGCLVGESLVITDRGDLPIRDVVVGDGVWTPAGFAKVLNSGPTKVATELIEITTADGGVLIATPEHKIFTTRGVITADALRYDDCVYNHRSYPCLSSQSTESMGYRDALIEIFKANGTGTGQPEAFMPVKSAADSAYCTSRYTQPFMANQQDVGASVQLTEIARISTLITGFTSGLNAAVNILFKSLQACVSTGSVRATTKQINARKEAYTCTALYGCTTTAASLTGFMSTTKTETRPTTPLKTWNYWMRQRIQNITEKITRGLAASETKGKSRKPVSLPSNGMQVKKAESGIPSMASSHGKTANGMPLIASSAGKNFPRHIQREPSSATPIAELRRYAPNSETLVYDLTVEKHHCYFANGVLVSNCDAFRYLGQAVDLMTSTVSDSVTAFKNRKRSWR